MDSADWELEPGAGGAALGLSTGLASLSSSRHGGVFSVGYGRTDTKERSEEVRMTVVGLGCGADLFFPPRIRSWRDRSAFDQSDSRYADGPPRILAVYFPALQSDWSKLK